MILEGSHSGDDERAARGVSGADRASGGRRAFDAVDCGDGRRDAAHGEPVARPLCARGAGRLGRQAAPRAEAEIRCREPQTHPGSARSTAAGGVHPLDRAVDRGRTRGRARAAGVARPAGAQARSRRPQILVREQRSGLRRQGGRRGRSLRGAARERDRDLRGREALDPGVGTGAGLFEAAQRPGSDRPQPRLQAPRHHPPCSPPSRLRPAR